MRLFSYAVRDVKAEHYSKPFWSVAPGEALRSFQMECENPESMLHRFPDDFHLFRLGEFNQLTGELVPQLPLQVCSARDFVKAEGVRQLELIDRKEAM